MKGGAFIMTDEGLKILVAAAIGAALFVIAIVLINLARARGEQLDAGAETAITNAFGDL